MQQDKYQEGEHDSLLPTTHPPTNVKPRTVCYQEGENDEDIIGSNMTMPTTSIPKNYLHGSREGLIAYGKHGRLMKLIDMYRPINY